jgi:putative bacteriocin precursor
MKRLGKKIFMTNETIEAYNSCLCSCSCTCSCTCTSYSGFSATFSPANSSTSYSNNTPNTWSNNRP